MTLMALLGGSACDKGDGDDVTTASTSATTAGSTSGTTELTDGSSSSSISTSSDGPGATSSSTTGDSSTASADDSSTGETTGGSSAVFVASPALMVGDVYLPVRANLDGDGADDVVISRNNSPSFIALLGAAPTEVVYYPGEGTGALAVLDFDGDGDADVLGNQYSLVPGLSRFASVRNDAATFTDVAVQDVSNCTDPRSTAVGDVDEDGISDAVLGCSFEFVLVRGTGDGGFGLAQQLDLSVPYNELVLLDVIGSPSLDLVNVDAHGVVQVFTGAGDGTFTVPATQSSRSTTRSRWPSATSTTTTAPTSSSRRRWSATARCSSAARATG